MDRSSHDTGTDMAGRWVPVLVRSEDYAEITALVLDRERNRTVDVEPPGARYAISEIDRPSWSPPQEATDQRSNWSATDLRHLSSSASKTGRRWTLALDTCAQARSSGEFWLSTSAVAERSGMTINEWRDAVRKMSRHLSANYPNVPLSADGDPVWPLTGRKVAGSAEVQWSISDELATIWINLRRLSAEPPR